MAPPGPTAAVTMAEISSVWDIQRPFRFPDDRRGGRACQGRFDSPWFSVTTIHARCWSVVPLRLHNTAADRRGHFQIAQPTGISVC